MAKRKPLSKSVRFEVFKRDSFTCQYCGRTSPDVVLEVDHIVPVAKGGGNELLNLVTSCMDCNRGKGKKKLDDSSTLKKQQQELKEMNERKQQMEMMIEWKKEMLNLSVQQIDFIETILFPEGNKTLTEFGRQKVKSYIRRFGFDEVCQASEIAYEKGYYDMVNKIGGICYNRKNGRTW